MSLRIFLTLYVLVAVIGVLARAYALSTKMYPRTAKVTAGEDVTALITGLLIAVWAFSLLWGLPQ